MIKEITVPEIIPEHHLLEEELILRRVDPRIFHTMVLGEGVESFDLVDIDLSINKSFAMVDPFVAATKEGRTLRL